VSDAATTAFSARHQLSAINVPKEGYFQNCQGPVSKLASLDITRHSTQVSTRCRNYLWSRSGLGVCDIRMGRRCRGSSETGNQV